VGAYQKYCRGEGVEPLPVTRAKAVNWLAWLANHTTLQGATIANYKSALRKWADVQSRWQGPNPVAAPLVHMVVKGIRAAKLPAEVAQRQRRPPPFLVTAAMLQSIEHVLCAPAEGPAGLMRWAAACVASNALTRPNELVSAVRLEERALRPEQIRFYQDAARTRIAPLLPFGHAASPPTVPHSFTVDFGIAKNDPGAVKPPYSVDSRTAVDALWRWFHLRRDILADGPELFRLPGKAPLAMAELLRSIERAREAIGLEPQRIEGRAFRRGGCAELVAAGASLDGIRNRGRWATKGRRIVELYAGQTAIKARAAAALAGTAKPL
jgi:hypothetical protein